MAQKYRVDIEHLVDHNVGDEVTAEDLEKVGGNVDHLLKLGAISAVKPTKKESEG